MVSRRFPRTIDSLPELRPFSHPSVDARPVRHTRVATDVHQQAPLLDNFLDDVVCQRF
jgi:hypothetical protein